MGCGWTVVGMSPCERRPWLEAKNHRQLQGVPESARMQNVSRLQHCRQKMNNQFQQVRGGNLPREWASEDDHQKMMLRKARLQPPAHTKSKAVQRRADTTRVWCGEIQRRADTTRVWWGGMEELTNSASGMGERKRSPEDDPA